MPVPKPKPLEPTRTSRESIQKLARGVASKYRYHHSKTVSTLVTSIGGSWSYVNFTSLFLVVDGPKRFSVLIPSPLSAQQASLHMARMIGHYVLHSQVGKKPIRIPADLDEQGLLSLEASWFAEALLSEPPALSAIDRLLMEEDLF